MGYCISSLTDTTIMPEFLKGYCIYLVKEFELTGVAKHFSTNFRSNAKRLGDSGSIITALDNDSYDRSFRKILKENSWFEKTIGDYFTLPPGIIITYPDIRHFRALHGQTFIYVSDQVINLAYHDPDMLSQDIIDLCRHNEFRFIREIKPYSRESIVSPKTRANRSNGLSEALMLEPNWFGLGMRLKPILKKLLHHGNHQKQYDCVIFHE